MMGKLESLDDEVLFERMTHDDEQALEEFFKRYFYKLCHFVFQLTKEESSSEEIVSDVFINLWLKRKQITIYSNFKSYLFRSAKNATLNHLSNQKNPDKLTTLDELERGFFAQETSADSYLHFKELQKEVNDLIHQLPTQQKVILQLNKIEGFSPSEISDLLEISQKTVYNNLYQAVKFLSRYYKKTIESLVLLIFLFLQN